MGTVTLNKNNRLFWLGRYAERLYQDVEAIRDMLDSAIDSEPDFEKICKKIGVVNDFNSVEDFCYRCCFNKNIQQSVMYSAHAMIGNGMVLREVIGSQTLSYLQMAVIAVESAENSPSPAMAFQWVLDDIMAFRGCYSELVASQVVRNTIKAGASVERIGAMVKTGMGGPSLEYELEKLTDRMKKSKLKHSNASLQTIKKFTDKEDNFSDTWALLSAVESLLIV
ncbi:MAG: alpha-E domain-containing protein [Bacillota bacterium]